MVVAILMMALLNVGLGYALGVIWLRQGGREQTGADSPPDLILRKLTATVRQRLVPARVTALLAQSRTTIGQSVDRVASRIGRKTPKPDTSPISSKGHD